MLGPILDSERGKAVFAVLGPILGSQGSKAVFAVLGAQFHPSRTDWPPGAGDVCAEGPQGTGHPAAESVTCPHSIC